MNSFLSIRSALSSLLGKTFGGARNLYQVFGYKQELLPEHFYSMYLRNDIANRVIRAYPQATWRDIPNVNSENEKLHDEFVKLYKNHSLANYFERADRLSSIGHFGLLFMGFQDGKSVAEPLEPGDHPLLYLRPYAENNINVTTWNMNTQSARYGMPETYTLQVGNPVVGTRRISRSINVHHSRVIHIAEILDEDDIFGVPRLMAIYNRLEDMEKVVGGSAETFWLTANRGLVLKAMADADIKDPDKLKEHAEEYQHQLRRVLTLQGMEVESIGSDTPSPKDNFEVLINLISGTTAIPKRILIGSEAGQLASSQDETNWNSRVDERRNIFAAPNIVRPFIEKMMVTGNLPIVNEFDVAWDETASMSEKDIADIQKKRSETVDRLDRTGMASIETKLQIMHPEWGEDDIKEEIKKIREQGGLPNVGA